MKIFNTLLITSAIALSMNIHSDERASYGNCYVSLGYIQGSLPSRVAKFVESTGMDPTKMEVFERKDKKLYFTLGQINENLYKSIKREGLTIEGMSCSSGKGYLARYNLDSNYNLIYPRKRYTIRNVDDYLSIVDIY
tara:strand:+ start:1441 stop:1851 length:411 start_codon:yes stop_codon:yes gene_type:complete